MKTRIQNLFIALVWLALPALAQAQFTFTTNSGAITITGYNTAAGLNAVIPAATNGYPVTSIGNDAFNSSGITNVTIPNSVTSIGYIAFGGCASLTSVTIPNSVTSIVDRAFEECTRLTNINVDAANPACSSLNGVLFDKVQATLLQFPGGLGGSYTIPNSVTSIGTWAFAYCRSLTSVALPDSITSIGADAFTVCTNLTSVTIPNSVTSMGDNAFNGCTSLTSVTIPNSVTSIENGVFLDTSLTSVAIPNSVTNIGNNAFEDCYGLTNVTIPNSVTSIGFYAFEYCYSLTNATIGNGVTSIGKFAFQGDSLTSVTIPDSVTSIGADAFEDCYGLTSAYFLGNAPPDDGTAFIDYRYGPDPATVYYLAGTTGWGSYFGGVPAVLWNPQASAFGFTGGKFGFNITGPANAVVVVEACANLFHPVWLPVSTNTLSGLGTSAFSDPQSGAYPMRYYRFRSP